MFECNLPVVSSQWVFTNLLQLRGWSIARVARITGLTREQVQQIQLGEQRFCTLNVEALAQASGQKSYDMVFNAVNVEEMSPSKRGLYDLALKMIQEQREFNNVIPAKVTKKPRSRTTARAAKTSPKPAARRGFART